MVCSIALVWFSYLWLGLYQWGWGGWNSICGVGEICPMLKSLLKISPKGSGRGGNISWFLQVFL
jgi:hypothetical protein